MAPRILHTAHIYYSITYLNLPQDTLVECNFSGPCLEPMQSALPGSPFRGWHVDKHPWVFSCTIIRESGLKKRFAMCLGPFPEFYYVTEPFLDNFDTVPGVRIHPRKVQRTDARIGPVCACPGSEVAGVAGFHRQQLLAAYCVGSIGLCAYRAVASRIRAGSLWCCWSLHPGFIVSCTLCWKTHSWV